MGSEGLEERVAALEALVNAGFFTGVDALREEMQSAHGGTFVLLVELLEALKWLARDGADRDDCEKAKPHLERAQSIVDMVRQAEAAAAETQADETPEP